MNSYDKFGWYSAGQYPKRQAPNAPANLSTSETVGELRANWNGFEWVDLPYFQGTAPDVDAELAQEVQRLTDIEQTVRGDSQLAQLKVMTNAEFDAWWTANVTNAAQAAAILKKLVKLIIFKRLI